MDVEAGSPSRQDQQRTLQRKIKALEEKLFTVDEKFIEGDLAKDSYQRLNSKYTAELTERRTSLDTINVDELKFTSRSSSPRQFSPTSAQSTRP